MTAYEKICRMFCPACAAGVPLEPESSAWFGHTKWVSKTQCFTCSCTAPGMEEVIEAQENVIAAKQAEIEELKSQVACALEIIKKVGTDPGLEIK